MQPQYRFDAAGPSERSRSRLEFLSNVLTGLYQEQSRVGQLSAYLVSHGSPKSIRDHVQAHLWYSEFLPMSGRVLDLACHHGPDSCLIQASYPGRFELYGCDIGPGSQHTVFHGYSGMTYRQVTDTTRIPFESEMFDGVVGSGALEHTAWDYECLKEVYRVLRPGGVFIITYLPNWVSWKEWYCQLVLKNGYHLRRYSKSELRWLLKHTGFRPLTIQCQNVGALGLTGKEWLWRQLVEWVRPDRYFRTVLCGVAHKMTVM